MTTETQTKQKQYIQVGIIAPRDRATGEFGTAVPLYVEADIGDAAAADIATALCGSKPFRDMFEKAARQSSRRCE